MASRGGETKRSSTIGTHPIRYLEDWRPLPWVTIGSFSELTLLGLQFRVGDSWGQLTWNLSGTSPNGTGVLKRLTPLEPQSRFGDKLLEN